MYQVQIIHPNANAEFTMMLRAASKWAATHAAYRAINDRFPKGMYMVGEITRVGR